MGWRLKFRHATIQVRGADSTTLSSPSLSSFRVCSMHAHWGSAWSFVRCPLSLSPSVERIFSLTHTHNHHTPSLGRRVSGLCLGHDRSLPFRLPFISLGSECSVASCVQCVCVRVYIPAKCHKIVILCVWKTFRVFERTRSGAPVLATVCDTTCTTSMVQVHCHHSFSNILFRCDCCSHIDAT